MLGQVYQIKIQGHYQKLPHPHVVLLELARECLLVPAFSEGGAEVEGVLRVYQGMGYSANTISVLLDNERHVTFRPPFTGLRAHWLLVRALKMSKADLKKEQLIGQMSDTGVLLIAKGYEAYGLAHPNRVSLNMMKKIRKLIESLPPPVKGVAPTVAPAAPLP